MDYDGVRWKPSGELTCLNVSFTYHQFRYRLDRTSGKLTWRDDRILGKLASFIGNKRIGIDIDVANPGDHFLVRSRSKAKA
ncbi:MAG: hypothetical protein QM811_10540 [Pirellulales bacterium]